jgi:LCP family protein required for cell wall assembly
MTVPRAEPPARRCKAKETNVTDAPAPPGATASAPRRPSWLRRHKLLSGFLVLLLLLGAAAGGWLLYLQQLTGGIDRVDLGLDDADRPPRASGSTESSGALNILVAGADNGASGNSIADDVASGTWEPYSHRSDTIMVMHVSADRDSVSLVSIPRDAYVQIYDENGDPTGKSKINDAFSRYGPAGYVSTVEHLTDLRMDHLAIMEWAAFSDLTTALGGVQVYIPETFRDTSQDITWEKGMQLLVGERALAYVRTRYGLDDGDFGRIERQQNFMRALLDKLVDNGTMSNPVKVTKVLQVVSRNLIVDEGWEDADIQDLVFSLRGVRADDVTFVTAPLGTYDTTRGGASIVRLAQPDTDELWDSIRADDVQRWAAEHAEDRLGEADDVN